LCSVPGTIILPAVVDAVLAGEIPAIAGDAHRVTLKSKEESPDGIEEIIDNVFANLEIVNPKDMLAQVY